MLNNYSKSVQSALKKFKVGERVKITKDGNTQEGLLMPRIELGDTDSVVIKLDSGYNIGVKYGHGMKIEKSSHKEPAKIKQEVDFEMNKEKFGKLKFDPKKPNVTIISTGGTIASKVEYKTGGVKAIENPEELLFNVPELKEIANIKFVTACKKMSEDMEYTDWQTIAKIAAREMTLGNAIVIAHGTDTMHYTAAALSFMLKTTKPVVLVGSQRSPDRGSSDAGMNLICAVRAALSEIGEVGIVMHGSTDDQYCTFNRGTRVIKTHKTKRDTFKTLGEEPIARIYPDGKIDTLTDYRKKDDKKIELDLKFEPRVALVIAYPNSDPDILNYYAKKGYRGIVVEGTGMGHVPTSAKKAWLPVIKKLSKKIPIVICSQAYYGRINTNVYENLRKLFYETNAIPSEDMLPHVAYIKLAHILGHTKDMKKIKEFMLTNITGEFTSRSSIS